jgi:hypothetical protein
VARPRLSTVMSFIFNFSSLTLETGR